MVNRRWISIIPDLSVVLFLCLLCFLYPTQIIAGNITPNRVITVVEDQPEAPEWKILWDEARKNVQDNKLHAASKLYEQLFRIKPDIEAANWEYCKVLLKTDDFSSAAAVISPLLEKDPNRLDYLMAAGQIALHQKEYSAAFKLYGKVYEVDPGGIHSTAALRGMIASLKGEGKDEVAFPLLEQLQARESDNRQLLYEIAGYADALGKSAKADAYYKKLLGDSGLDLIDDQILFDSSKFYENSDNRRDAVPLWREYIRRNPDYLPFYHKLADYFIAEHDERSALPYLLHLSERINNNSQLLITIAEIYLYQLGRPDKALRYYEIYMKKNPGDQEVLAEISRIQSTLANDFLSIVENDGALQLWQDLEEITPNRLEIYLKMADLFEQQGKFTEQLEILLILHNFRPQDDSTTYKIVDNYRKRKEYGSALRYLQDITAVNSSSKNYFLLKGNIEELQGLEEKALHSYIKGLEADSSDFQLRHKCIAKAGALGMIDELDSLFKDAPPDYYSKENIDSIIHYFDQVKYNFLFSQLDTLYSRFFELFKNNPGALFRIQLHQAGTMRTRGKLRKAEALYRKLLNLNISEPELLFLLTANAVDDGQIETARSWYHGFSEKINSIPEPLAGEKKILRMKKILLEAKLMLAAEDCGGAASLLLELKKILKKPAERRALAGEISSLQTDLCWLYLKKEKYPEYKALILLMERDKKFTPDINVTLNIFNSRPAKTSIKKSARQALYIGKQPIVSRLIQMARVELKHGEYDAADRHLQAVLEQIGDSLVARVLLAELWSGRGNPLKSTGVYRDLHTQYPAERFFERRIVENESRRGMYKKGLTLLYQDNKDLKKADNAQSYKELNGDFGEIVLLARMLWGSRQLEKSLNVYELLLFPPVIELLGNKFEQEETYYLYFTREKSFWTSLLSLLQTEPEIIAELMAPEFLVDNMGSRTGKIVADYYELYSWQKLLQNEYLARKAIVQRKYEAAKRNYKRLLEEGEGSSESLRDLASIYDRLGEYRKEAQIYEKLRDKGETIPAAVDSMKIRPHLGLDGGFTKKSGRDGYLNLENWRLGTSLLYTPDLEKDVKFQFFRNHYEEVDGDQSISGIFLESSGIIEIRSDTDLHFSAAAEKLDGRSGTNFYYSIGLQSQLDDFFNSYIEIYKNKVDDTLDAVLNGVNSDGFEVGLVGETSGGITVGGDYRHRYYSDGNAQNRFHAYSSYKFYRESIHVGFKYDFQYLDNSDSNKKNEDREEWDNDNDFYWKPAFFSDHQFTLHYKQLIKGNYGTGDLLSYFTFDNSIGFEDPQNVLYTGKFDIFLEMSPHYLLKGNFLFANSEDYEEISFLFSLYYRW